MPQELRVGICECTDAFGDRLNGRQIDLPSHSLRLVQVPIGGVDHIPDIRTFRTHFFLDTVDYSGETRLNQIKFHSPKIPAGEELVRVGHKSDQSKWWGGTVPTPQAIVEAMATILGNMGSAKLGQWLDTMTPTGWTMPARSLVLAAPSCEIGR